MECHMDLKQQLLQQAAKRLGREYLATRLAIPAPLLDAWMRGDATMPDGKLLVLAAILDKAPTEKRD